MSKVPSFLKPIVDAAKPAAIGLAAVGVGALNAQVGSAVLKAAVAQVDAFAAKSALHEAGVDLGAGVALDAVTCVGVAMWKGARAAAAVAPLLLIGTGVSAAAPVVAPRFAQFADKIVGALMPSRAQPAPGGFLTGHDTGSVIPGGGEMGGVIPGGDDDYAYAGSALGGTI